MHYSLYSGLAIVLWACLALLVTQLDHLPPFFLLAVTFAIGGSLSLFKLRQWQLDWKLWLFGICGIFGYHYLLFMALRLAPPIEANMINYLWPLFIVLLSPIYLKGFTLSRFHILGGLAGFAGVYLLLNGAHAMFFSSNYISGYLLAFAAAISWASYSLLSKRLTELRTATIGLFCLLSSLLCWMAHFCVETSPKLNNFDWVFLLLLGLGPMGIAFYAWDKGLKAGDPRLIGTFSYLTPLLSTLLLLIFSEREFEIYILYSMLLIIGGAIVASIKAKSN